MVWHTERVSDERFKNSDGIPIYYDALSGNQDPYIWNKQFLYSYCQLGKNGKTWLSKINEGDCIFFVATRKGSLTVEQWWCDLVFVVAEKLEWNNKNPLEKDDLDLVESEFAWKDHYRWWIDHPNLLLGGKRITFKADPDSSFQPIGPDNKPLDILKHLNALNIDTSPMIGRSYTGRLNSSWPRELESHVGEALLKKIMKTPCEFRHYGDELQEFRKDNSHLWKPSENEFGEAYEKYLTKKRLK